MAYSPLLVVAGPGLEPGTSGLWAQRAANCSIPRYSNNAKIISKDYFKVKFRAGKGNRTPVTSLENWDNNHYMMPAYFLYLKNYYKE